MDKDSKKASNLAALKKLRELPRGTNVESRIAAIQNLLGEAEIFSTIQNLRWPLGIVCPNCHSHNIILIESPTHAKDQRQYYKCLDCEKGGNPSGFDDLTNLNMIDTFHDLHRWVLCWYLMGFCSISQIAKTLGLSMHEVIEMAEQGASLTELHEEKLDKLQQVFFSQRTKKEAVKKKKEDIAHDELKTRSEGLGKFKPGPKSSK